MRALRRLASYYENGQGVERNELRAGAYLAAIGKIARFREFLPSGFALDPGADPRRAVRARDAYTPMSNSVVASAEWSAIIAVSPFRKR